MRNNWQIVSLGVFIWSFGKMLLGFEIEVLANSEIPKECAGIEFAAEAIMGTEGDDDIAGTSGNDLIFALGGEDVVEGLAGNDCIIGGEGDDSISGGSGDDVILGNEGADYLEGGSGNDVMFGGEGNDAVHGGSGDDKLYANSGADYLDGGSDSDYGVLSNRDDGWTNVEQLFIVWPLVNFSSGNLIDGYNDPPIGDVELGGIPFSIPVTNNSYMSARSGISDVSVDVEMAGVKKLFLLINTYDTFIDWGVNGQIVGKIKLEYISGQSFEVDLVIGKNIREWRQGNDAPAGETVNTVTDPSNQEVFSSGSPQGTGTAVIDLLTVTVSENLQNDILTQIVLSDEIPESAGIVWSGLTTEHVNLDEEPIPAPSEKLPVIFVPGTYATKLWFEDAGDTCTGEIWQNRLFDVARAFKNGNEELTVFHLGCFSAIKLDEDGTGLPFPFSGTIEPNGVTEFVIKNIIEGEPKEEIDFYKSFITFMDENGFPAKRRGAEHPLLFVFPYDWRLSIPDNAQKLKLFIDEVLETVNQGFYESPPIKKVQLVGHSQGGILIRQLLATDPDSDTYIFKAVYVGAPFYGLIPSLEALKYGTEDLFSLPIASSFLPVIREAVKNVAQNTPSIYQMLPSRSYGSQEVYPNYYMKEDGSQSYDDMLTELNEHNQHVYEWTAPVHRLDNPVFWNDAGQNISQYFLVGTKQATPVRIYELSHWLFQAEDDKYSNHRLILGDGDGTVPTKSAEWFENVSEIGGIAYYFKDVLHGIMFADHNVQTCIQDILTATSQSEIINCSNNSENLNIGTLISLHSPAWLSAKDVLGNTTGTDDGLNFKIDIPYSKLHTIGEEQFIFLPYAANPYRLEVTSATESGAFDLRIEKLESDQDKILQPKALVYFNSIPLPEVGHVFSGEVNSDEIESFLLESDNSPPLFPDAIVVDEAVKDIYPPTTITNLEGLQGQDSWYGSKVVMKIAASDQGSGILKIFYRVDGETIEFVQPISFINEGWFSVEVTAVDKVGNWQIEQSKMEFGIDKTSPDVNITPHKDYYNLGDLIDIMVIDDVSGLYKVEKTLDNQVFEKTELVLDQPGEHTLTVKAEDMAGNVAEVSFEFMVMAFKTVINDDELYTNSRRVRLALDYSTETKLRRVSNRRFEVESKYPRWKKATTQIDWHLSGDDGEKTVYAQFMDDEGNVSELVSDSIILDTKSPHGKMEINQGEWMTDSESVNLQLAAKDEGSGTKEMLIRNYPSGSGSWQAYQEQVEWELEPFGFFRKIGKVTVLFKDAAGNVSPPAYDWIIVK